jgi:hypothetical protein
MYFLMKMGDVKSLFSVKFISCPALLTLIGQSADSNVNSKIHSSDVTVCQFH